MITILLILIVGLNILEAFVDTNVKKDSKGSIKHIKLWHTLDAIYKAIVFLLIALLTGTTLPEVMILLLTFLTLRFTVFSWTHNLLNNQKWYYVGTVSWQDIQLRKLPKHEITTTVIKVLSTLVSILLLLIY